MWSSTSTSAARSHMSYTHTSPSPASLIHPSLLIPSQFVSDPLNLHAAVHKNTDLPPLEIFSRTSVTSKAVPVITGFYISLFICYRKKKKKAAMSNRQKDPQVQRDFFFSCSLMKILLIMLHVLTSSRDQTSGANRINLSASISSSAVKDVSGAA